MFYGKTKIKGKNLKLQCIIAEHNSRRACYKALAIVRNSCPL